MVKLQQYARPRAYSYVRMSTDLQLKGDSLRRQLEASREYAETHSLDLVRDVELHDIGVSAIPGKISHQGASGGFWRQFGRGKSKRDRTCWSSRLIG